MKRLATIPTVFAFVASVALLGCGDLGTGPSLDGLGPELLDMVGDPTIDRNGDLLRCEKVVGENTGRVLVIDNNTPDGADRDIRNDCPEGFLQRGF